jgi:hypothetical protein
MKIERVCECGHVESKHGVATDRCMQCDCSAFAATLVVSGGDSLTVPRPWSEIGIACDLSMTSLQEAALKCGPSFSYTLHCCMASRFHAYDLARMAQVPQHPLAPYISVVVDGDRFSKDGEWARPWWLVNDMNNTAFGSEGC